jgi:hypothetical protein
VYIDAFEMLGKDFDGLVESKFGVKFSRLFQRRRYENEIS